MKPVRRFCTALALILSFLVVAAPVSSQQRSDGGYDGVRDGTDRPTSSASGQTPVWGGSAYGYKVATWIADASNFCASVDRSYQIDCLAERFETIAASIPANSAYAPQKQALQSAARRMTAVADKYWDRNGARKTYRTAGPRPQSSTRPLRPIAAAAAPAALAAARAIVAETQTVLLRSSAGQPGEAAQIEQIAAAVGSNKILLRSV